MFDRIKEIILSIYTWIFSHKKIVFIYIPLLCIVMFSLYVVIIYFSWQSDKNKALLKLKKYKQLIDRTEELRKGYVYSYKDIDLSAKVVDIPTRIYDRNNEIIGEFFEQKREIVPHEYIPEWLIKGVIASEDRVFKEHKGISYKGIIRAFFNNLIHLGVVQGGSTITQQLAKVLFTDMDRSIKRKIYESFCALEIEKKYDKDDIMSMYLNLIYFGNGSYGVESTSKMFFGKSVKELNEVECAMIVATISSPKTYSPLSNLNNSIRKTKRILQSLVDAKYLNQKKSEQKYKSFLLKWNVVFSQGEAVSSSIGKFIYSSYKVNRAPFFNEMIRRVLVEKFGEEVVKKGGLSVYTTIDAEKQDVALVSLKKGVANQREYHLNVAKRIKNTELSQKEMEKAENIEGALISINPFTGEIISYVGGSEFTSKNQNDSVSQIKRQPGSSFKPIIYTAAIESKDITPSTIFEDKKTVFKGGYSPRNYSGNYMGNVTVDMALRKSINIVAVKVLEKTGYKKIFQILKDSLYLSNSELNKRFGKTFSLALGTYEISPEENCTLHSVIVNGGDYVKPYGIKYVKDYNDHIVWNNEEEVQKLIEERRNELGKIIDPVAAAVTVSMLKGVLEKTGTGYWAVKDRGIKFEIAGKTGTSTNYNDAWFVGYTSNLVTSIWIGNKTGAVSLGSGRAGGAIAAPLWGEYISLIYKENAPGNFIIPTQGISKENICLESGKVALRNGECPEVVQNQLYYQGTEPGEFCDIHKKENEPEKKSSEDNEEK